ncbi:FecR domain-containing protein [Novosphingobium sp. ZN18A2]|uniref:FecR family protein n=1 Tax=Novosphingobium sp. ZN18A2 TaxID=3079861 RepID=UPI0030CBFC7B
MTDTDRILSQAAAWHVATVHDDMDWDAFTAWLEEGARHAAAYAEVAEADALVEEHSEHLAQLDLQPPTQDTDAAVSYPRNLSRRWFAGGMVAAIAAAVAILVVPSLRGKPDSIYETAASARTIALTDGSTVRLAPHSRLAVSGDDPAHLALAGGAWFDVRHDPSRHMRIAAGPATISDIGTRFDVQTTPSTVRVGVAEGALRVTSGDLAQPVALHAGQALTFDAGAHRAAVRSAARDDIGAWRSGRLTYEDAPLALVAGDLGRYAGVSVRVASGLEDRHFSGTLVIGDGAAAIRDLSQLMGLSLGRDAGGYRLGPAAR